MEKTKTNKNKQTNLMLVDHPSIPIIATRGRAATANPRRVLVLVLILILFIFSTEAGPVVKENPRDFCRIQK